MEPPRQRFYTMVTTPSHSRLWIVVVAALAITAAGANWFFRLRSSEATSALESTDARNLAELEAERIVCFGHVDVETGVRFLAPVQSGRVVGVWVHESEHVEANDVLLTLDDSLAVFVESEAQADLDAAQAQLTQANHGPAQYASKLAQQQAAIAAIGRRLAAAQQVLARKRGLEKIEQLSAEEVAAAAEQVAEVEAVLKGEQEKLREMQLFDPQAELARAKANVAAKRAKRDQARKARRECVLHAPVAGEVLRVYVGVGDVLGLQPRQAAVLFCPDGPRFVRTEVSQEFADRIRVGLPARIQNDTGELHDWTGSIVRISDWYTQRRSVMHEPLQINDIRTLECLVRVESGPPLRIGQRMRVTLGGRSSSD